MEGRIHLGVYAVSKQGTCKWLAFDCDDPRTFQGLAAMASVLSPAGNVLLERSRRAGHCWLFCPPTPWPEVVAYGHFLKQEYGLQGVEIYPPSGELKAIKLPGTRHPKDGKFYPFLDPQTGEVIPTLAEAIGNLTPRPFPRVTPQADEPRVLERADPLSNVGPPAGASEPLPPGTHQELMAEITKLTKMRYFGRHKAQGLCPWHPDHNPSLAVVEGYFRCFAASCGVRGGVLAWKKLMRERTPMPRR